ncbi:MAG TPA: DUF2461 domain-containing protein [Candidatus Baltobacteraceae bacterium]|jgi:uncharacterized protein (TIGR02453 family)|nr:DUF2461 domain-containing protein [Candidatus Baltobacteraceae bacterium]
MPLPKTSPSFAGFSPEALRFLRGLAAHNERAWFNARKGVYEREVRDPMRALVADLTTVFTKLPLRGDDHSIFRIYRDVRFGHDKSPYKTHVAAYLSYDGGRETPGGLYIHVEPGECFLSLAFYRLPPPMLRRWRERMAADPRSFRTLLNKLDRAGMRMLPPEDWEDALARMPRGFEEFADSPIAPWFRVKSFCLHLDLNDSVVQTRELVKRCIAFVRAGKPLLDYGWSLE